LYLNYFYLYYINKCKFYFNSKAKSTYTKGFKKVLNLTLVDFLLRSIPEEAILTYALYVFSDKKLEVKKYICLSLLLSLYTFAVRAFPIEKYVHTLIFLVGYILMAERFVNIKMFKAISICLFSVILLAVTELLNMMLLSYFYNLPLQQIEEFILQDPIKKIIYGLPSLLIFIIVLAIAKLLKKQNAKES